MNRLLLVIHLIALAIRLVTSEVDISELELVENDEDMLNCFRDLCCKHDKSDEFRSCFTAIRSNREKEFLDLFVRNLAPEDFNYTGVFQIEDFFCKMNSEEQKDLFDVLIAELLEKYMDVCNGQDIDTCEDYKNMFECEMAFMEKATSDGLCDL